jgi:hypothetical protein
MFFSSVFLHAVLKYFISRVCTFVQILCAMLGKFVIRFGQICVLTWSQVKINPVCPQLCVVVFNASIYIQIHVRYASRLVAYTGQDGAEKTLN